ncbi:Hsp20/alpha crystallin family protein [Gallaecimonas sp. GXIMD4217]|uniref:Hsp20/alpha crystallin family protein n=1 Tax=Gallaecimonas sp. GXIMD4217 TaxID=3131927 RepID=UPI00311AFC0C
MIPARWNPFKEFDDLLSSYVQRHPLARLGGEDATWLPAVDIDEDDNAFHLAMEIPGMDKDNVKVRIQNGMLEISGERQVETKGEKHRQERFYGSFSRSFSLPDNVDQQGISARFDNGVLHLALPKRAAAEPDSHEIAID